MRFLRSGLTKRVIAFFLSLILFCIISLTTIFYFRTSSIITQSTTEGLAATADGLSREMDVFAEELNQAMRLLTTSPYIQDIDVLSTEVPIETEAVKRLAHVQALLSGITNANRALQSILLYNAQGEVLRAQYTTESPIEAEVLMRDEWYAEHPNKFLYVPSENTGIIQFCRQLKDMDEFGKIGYVQFNVRAEILATILENRTRQYVGDFYVLGENGQTIAGATSRYGLEVDDVAAALTSNTESGSSTIGESRYLMAQTVSNSTGWVCVCVVSVADATTPLQSLLYTSIGIGVVLCALAIGLAVFLTLRITRPIIQIADSMERFEQGDFKTRITYKGHDEIGKLANSYNECISTIDHLINQVYALDLADKEQQIKMLQAQMTPHFLYNTLDTVNHLALKHGAVEISEIVVSLSALMRSSISAKGPMVTLAEDFALAEAYLAIMQVRFGDKLHPYYDIDEDTLGLLVPRLCIQPLIENAVLHGLETKPEGGVLQIVIVPRDGGVEISVEDDGVGMSEAHLARVISGKAGEDTGHSGQGLVFLQKRLRLIYGQSATFTVESHEGVGTKVTMWLPKPEEAGEAS